MPSDERAVANFIQSALMSWVTVVWSMIAAACLTLALVHGRAVEEKQPYEVQYRAAELSIDGVEKTDETGRLCRMNLH